MSSDEMPCGCLGHADYDHLCRYPVLEAEINSLREQVHTLTAERDEARREAEAQSAMVEAWSDALGLEKSDGYDKAEEVREERDALRARVAELEDDLSITTAKHIRCSEAWEDAARERDSFYERVSELESERDVERAMRLERETLLAGAREREEIAQAAVAQAVCERAAARDAALEEVASLVSDDPDWMIPDDDRHAFVADKVRALKAQPSRRFVEAEKVEAERRDAWIHGIETAAGIVAERGDDVQAASVVYDVLKARVEFERSQQPTEMDEVKETGRARHVCGWNGDPCTPACPAYEVKP